MGGGVALIIMIFLILGEKLIPAPKQIPEENWANQELIQKDRKSGISEEEIRRNARRGRYYIPKEVLQAYPIPHREPDGRQRLIIENCELHKSDVEQYGVSQAKKWLEQGKYNLNAEELAITHLQYELSHLKLITLCSSYNCDKENARMEEIKQILATKNWDCRNTEALKQWQAAHDAERRYTNPEAYAAQHIHNDTVTIDENAVSSTSQSSNFFQKHKGAVILTLCIIAVFVWVLTAPETVASGNGYSHQIGSFGECDMNFDDCTVSATHRRHHFFGNEDYCESCWEGYGEDMFERLSNTKSSSSKITHDEYKCRHAGCDNKAKFTDWERRFCPEHLQGNKYCRYPNCSEQIPINGISEYCWKHKSKS